MSTAKHAYKLKMAPWALLTVSIAWGFSFVVMKDAIERQTVNNFLFTRFGLAVIVMVAIKPKVIQFFTKDLLLRGGAAGLFLGSGYILQTLGLARTGAAITGFVTGLYIVLTPLIASLFFRERVTRFTWICVFIATIGLGLLSIRGWSVGFGELLYCSICNRNRIYCPNMGTGSYERNKSCCHSHNGSCICCNLCSSRWRRELESSKLNRWNHGRCCHVFDCYTRREIGSSHD